VDDWFALDQRHELGVEQLHLVHLLRDKQREDLIHNGLSLLGGGSLAALNTPAPMSSRYMSCIVSLLQPQLANPNQGILPVFQVSGITGRTRTAQVEGIISSVTSKCS
jgi:hypothetical protein